MLKESSGSTNRNCVVMDNYRLVTQNSLDLKKGELKSLQATVERLEIDINLEKEKQHKLNDLREIEHERIEGIKEGMKYLEFTLELHEKQNKDLEEYFKQKYDNLIFYQSQTQEDDSELKKMGLMLEKLEDKLKTSSECNTKVKNLNNSLKFNLSNLRKNFNKYETMHLNHLKELENCIELIGDQEIRISSTQDTIEATIQDSAKVYDSNLALKRDSSKKNKELSDMIGQYRSLCLKLDRRSAERQKLEDQTQQLQDSDRSLKIQLEDIYQSLTAAEGRIVAIRGQLQKSKSKLESTQAQSEAITRELESLKQAELNFTEKMQNLELIMAEKRSKEEDLKNKLILVEKEHSKATKEKINMSRKIEEISMDIKNQISLESSSRKRIKYSLDIESQKSRLIYNQQFQINSLENKLDYLKGRLDSSQLDAMTTENNKQRESIEDLKKEAREMASVIVKIDSQRKKIDNETETLNNRITVTRESIMDHEISIDVLNRRIEEKNKAIRVLIFHQSRVKYEILKHTEKRDERLRRYSNEKIEISTHLQNFDAQKKANEAQLAVLSEIQRQYSLEKRNLNAKKSNYLKKLENLKIKYQNLIFQINGGKSECEIDDKLLPSANDERNGSSYISEGEENESLAPSLADTHSLPAESQGVGETKLLLDILFTRHERLVTLREECQKLRNSNSKLAQELNILHSTHNALQRSTSASQQESEQPDSSKSRRYATHQHLRDQRQRFTEQLNNLSKELEASISIGEALASDVAAVDARCGAIQSRLADLQAQIQMISKCDERLSCCFVRLRKQIKTLMKNLDLVVHNTGRIKSRKCGDDEIKGNNSHSKYAQFIDHKLLALETSKLCALLKALSGRLEKESSRLGASREIDLPSTNFCRV
ncbi:MAG: Coiled-coil domain-containing protein 39 [Marteilia pararefringens]